MWIKVTQASGNKNVLVNLAHARTLEVMLDDAYSFVWICWDGGGAVAIKESLEDIAKVIGARDVAALTEIRKQAEEKRTNAV